MSDFLPQDHVAGVGVGIHMDQTHRSMPDKISQNEHWQRDSMWNVSFQESVLNYKQLFLL